MVRYETNGKSKYTFITLAKLFKIYMYCAMRLSLYFVLKDEILGILVKLFGSELYNFTP